MPQAKISAAHRKAIADHVFQSYVHWNFTVLMTKLDEGGDVFSDVYVKEFNASVKRARERLHFVEDALI